MIAQPWPNAWHTDTELVSLGLSSNPVLQWEADVPTTVSLIMSYLVTTYSVVSDRVMCFFEMQNFLDLYYICLFLCSLSWLRIKFGWEFSVWMQLSLVTYVLNSHVCEVPMVSVFSIRCYINCLTNYVQRNAAWCHVPPSQIMWSPW